MSLVFAPDGVSTANLVADIAVDLTQFGHEVSVLTTVPHFNYDSDARSTQPLTKKYGGLYYRSKYHDVDVWHTAIIQRGEGAGTARRMLGYMVYHVISFILGIFVIRSIDVILVVSPPLTSGVVSWLLGILKRAKTVYNIQELYPDTYVRNGAIKRDSSIARILYAIEKFVYDKSNVLTVISGDFQRTVIKKGVAEEKIKIIPNFVDVQRLKPGKKNNSFAQELGLVDKFVVLYAGNIGITQSFDSLLKAAELLKDETGIIFLIVGDGVQRNHVAKMIKEKKQSNVILQPYQPSNRVPDIYATADVGLVPLMTGNAHVTLPSKLYTIMATGTAALVAVDLDSDIVSVVQDNEAGIAVPPDDAQSLAKAVRILFEDSIKCRQYGENGRNVALSKYSRDIISKQYSDLLGSGV